MAFVREYPRLLEPESILALHPSSCQAARLRPHCYSNFNLGMGRVTSQENGTIKISGNWIFKAFKVIDAEEKVWQTRIVSIQSAAQEFGVHIAWCKILRFCYRCSNKQWSSFIYQTLTCSEALVSVSLPSNSRGKSWFSSHLVTMSRISTLNTRLRKKYEKVEIPSRQLEAQIWKGLPYNDQKKVKERKRENPSICMAGESW